MPLGLTKRLQKKKTVSVYAPLRLESSLSCVSQQFQDQLPSTLPLSAKFNQRCAQACTIIMPWSEEQVAEYSAVHHKLRLQWKLQFRKLLCLVIDSACIRVEVLWMQSLSRPAYLPILRVAVFEYKETHNDFIFRLICWHSMERKAYISGLLSLIPDRIWQYTSSSSLNRQQL